MSATYSVMLTWAMLVAAVSCQCERQFLTEPGVGVTSPLDCNIIGQEVRLPCVIEGTQLTIGWFFTTNPTLVGQEAVGEVVDNTNNRRISAGTTTTPSSFSTLIINAFDRSVHSGYYWCEITSTNFQTINNRNPSRVVWISPPTLPELNNTCSNPPVMFSSTTDLRCALDMLPQPIAIVSVTFSNVSIVTTLPTTTMAPTTMAPTTMAPTTMAPTTMAPTTEPEPTVNETPIATTEEAVTTTTEDPPNNTVRTAVIWFSVGAVLLIIIVVIIILCACAIARN